MTPIPSLVSDQKTLAAALDQQSFDDSRSVIGVQSEYGSPVSVYSNHVVQTMKLAKTIALACLAMTAVLGLFVMLNSSRACDCRYGDNSLETRNNPYFEPLMSSSEDSAKATGKRLPIRIQMEGDAGELMKKNKKGKVNCSVERKTATQIIASEPKMLITPYGNITTDPRIIQMTGEKMIFTCSAGKASKNKKDKGPRKFATVINLNDLDEKLDASSLTASASTTTSTTSESPLDRPKRSTGEHAVHDQPSKEHHKKQAHMTCDCHCPLDEN